PPCATPACSSSRPSDALRTARVAKCPGAAATPRSRAKNGLTAAHRQGTKFSTVPLANDALRASLTERTSMLRPVIFCSTLALLLSVADAQATPKKQWPCPDPPPLCN